MRVPVSAMRGRRDHGFRRKCELERTGEQDRSPANWLCRYPVLMDFLSARPCREGASRVLRVKKRTIGGCGEYAGERGLY